MLGKSLCAFWFYWDALNPFVKFCFLDKHKKFNKLGSINYKKKLTFVARIITSFSLIRFTKFCVFIRKDIIYL